MGQSPPTPSPMQIRKMVPTRDHTAIIVPGFVALHVEKVEYRRVRFFLRASESHDLAVLIDAKHDKMLEGYSTMLLHRCVDILRRVRGGPQKIQLDDLP